MNIFPHLVLLFDVFSIGAFALYTILSWSQLSESSSIEEEEEEEEFCPLLLSPPASFSLSLSSASAVRSSWR